MHVHIFTACRMSDEHIFPLAKKSTRGVFKRIDADAHAMLFRGSPLYGCFRGVIAEGPSHPLYCSGKRPIGCRDELKLAEARAMLAIVRRGRGS